MVKRVIGTRGIVRRLAILRNEGVPISPLPQQENPDDSPAIEEVEFEAIEEEIEYLRAQGSQLIVLPGQGGRGNGSGALPRPGKEKTMKYQVGDWVKCPGKGKILWVYGAILSIHKNPQGLRLRVDRGYLGDAFYSPEELAPAVETQSPAEKEKEGAK